MIMWSVINKATYPMALLTLMLYDQLFFPWNAKDDILRNQF